MKACLPRCTFRIIHQCFVRWNRPPLFMCWVIYSNIDQLRLWNTREIPICKGFRVSFISFTLGKMSLFIILQSPLFCHSAVSVVSDRFSFLIVCHFPLSMSFILHCLSFPIMDHAYLVYNFQMSFNLIMSNYYLTCHCLSFPIICHSRLFVIFHCQLVTMFCPSPLFGISCSSFTKVLHSSLSIIHRVFHFRLSLICHTPLFTIFNCILSSIVSHSHCMYSGMPHCLPITIVYLATLFVIPILCYSSLSIISHCLSFPIVCHPIAVFCIVMK